MQFLTGTIDRQTVRDLEVGTIFGLRQQGYSSDKEYICLVEDVHWKYDEYSDNPTDASTITYSYLEVGNSYGLTIRRDTVELSAPIWEKVVAVEPELAIYEFARQSTLAHAEMHRQRAATLEAQARLLAFDAMQDRIGL